MTSRFSTYVLALLLFCYSSDSYDPPKLPDPRDPKFIQDCVQGHNELRAKVDPGASDMLHMSWDPDLAKTAKGWARKCLFKHNIYLKQRGKVHPKFGTAGENIWTGSASAFTVSGALSAWFNEVKHYDYNTNKCTRVCGHYTQVVWATSYKVGCAVHFCPKMGYLSIRNAAHFVCNYGPPGNYPVRPYKTGAACSECGGDQCVNQLCRNAERDKVTENSRWRPEWDRSACDEFCISVIALRFLFLVLTIVATWLLPKYWSVVRISG
ncbi:glioma pathogenesis-related protein 1-like [Catharus ustulatus]|uniref:SCP domain-containing protein n=1 Tax=Catharus ustulatus TaxID=91951 RepID=A0A8C3U4H0_CATUS|nr:glioma pathogenesis-related protein 1-like [Catharus ustulatus]